MSAAKHRQPRLRASCDGCFLAKVKCSKSRPICSRCLACGIECRYSPSSRAGKPKADSFGGIHGHGHANGSQQQHHSGHGNQQHDPSSSSSPVADMAAMAAAAGFSSIINENGILYTTTGMSGITGWQSPGGGMDGTVGVTNGGGTSAGGELALFTTDETAAVTSSAAHHGDMYGAAAAAASMPWTPPADMSMAQFADASLSGMPITPHVGYTMATDVADGMPWTDAGTAMDYFPYSSSQSHNHGHGHSHSHSHSSSSGHGQQMPTPASSIASPNNFFPSPSTTPNLRQSPTSGHQHVPRHTHRGSTSTSTSTSSTSSSYHGGGGDVHGHGTAPCACFTSCLYSLQALHNASTPAAPPFDVVLALNRNAVDGCSAMLSCSRCMSRSGTHTAAMLLATVIGKVTSFYKNASLSYFTGESRAAVARLDSIVGGLEMGPAGAAAAASVAGGAIATDSTDAQPTPQPPTTAALTGLGVSLGAYHLQGEEGRWFELEILNRELKKLEDVYARFREVCAELSEDVEVSKAMIGYLGHTLGSTLNMVSHSKQEARFM